MVVWSFVRNFAREEFVCPCCGKEEMDYEFITRLCAARAMAGIPFKINSGYRCPGHDKEIGGGGEHCLGKASDIKCTDSRSRFIMIDNLLIAGFKRIGEAPDFVHVGSASEEDGYDQNVKWLY